MKNTILVAETTLQGDRKKLAKLEIYNTQIFQLKATNGLHSHCTGNQFDLSLVRLSQNSTK